ncbi:hypothetical protein [Halopelagius longus]|uniref:Halobacterial output domain-containing protein n=1 Tax=Halopelagius longus TaxID=1236180 RepID=A0A1H0XW70_9EURY|nr:hypothetical protein [Halopelagius longus]RDI72131.1 hypothetical protein DWB78_10625 [Halopelagius longus]SDQ07157.1 hypothetical protein SAMN05216278_0233 [Halopelagius longus]
MRSAEETRWYAIGRHRFDGPDELDASLLLSLDADAERTSCLSGTDPEAIEKLLVRARNAGVDLSVSLYVDGQEVRIDSDGVIAVRKEA